MSDASHDRSHVHPSYYDVFRTIVRNSLVRDMSFRSNFLIESISSLAWMMMNLGFYILVFSFTDRLAPGWGKYEFFAFLATTMLINSVVQAFFMPNAQEFSELIRTGNLDFALLKPIDTQFLVSLHRVEWSSLANFLVGVMLLVYSLAGIAGRPDGSFTVTPWMVIAYPTYVACGIAILYSLMITLASTSIWLGRNQSLYNFWFYITNFSRYPMEIYHGKYGTPLGWFFTYIIPVLVVVNVPARIVARPLTGADDGLGANRWPGEQFLVLFALVATLGSLIASRWVFIRALHSYRSASS